jgi:hypothetical protein
MKDLCKKSVQPKDYILNTDEKVYAFMIEIASKYTVPENFVIKSESYLRFYRGVYKSYRDFVEKGYWKTIEIQKLLDQLP